MPLGTWAAFSNCSASFGDPVDRFDLRGITVDVHAKVTALKTEYRLAVEVGDARVDQQSASQELSKLARIDRISTRNSQKTRESCNPTREKPVAAPRLKWQSQ
jgi:hypothetical protein